MSEWNSQKNKVAPTEESKSDEISGSNPVTFTWIKYYHCSFSGTPKNLARTNLLNMFGLSLHGKQVTRYISKPRKI